MKVFVGTSGWLYSWNLGGSLDWFLRNSGLNAVELNASFYRFPFPNQVKSWAEKGGGLSWSVKVNRLITHRFKFKERALNSGRKFERLFKPLDGRIDFYLFQLPPSMKPRFSQRLEVFIERTGLKERFALEVRNHEWFSPRWADWASSLGITLVSVDCPDLPLDVFNTSGRVYERMHGRTEWYAHYYSREELEEVAGRILEMKPERIHVFFNNNHAILENARTMLETFRNRLESTPWLQKSVMKAS